MTFDFCHSSFFISSFITSFLFPGQEVRGAGPLMALPAKSWTVPHSPLHGSPGTTNPSQVHTPASGFDGGAESSLDRGSRSFLGRACDRT